MYAIQLRSGAIVGRMTLERAKEKVALNMAAIAVVYIGGELELVDCELEPRFVR